MSCPNCTELEKNYGFHLEANKYYMTQLDKIKKCCPVKVFVTEVLDNTVIFYYKDQKFQKSKKDFYKSSWRIYDSF